MLQVGAVTSAGAGHGGVVKSDWNWNQQITRCRQWTDQALCCDQKITCWKFQLKINVSCRHEPMNQSCGHSDLQVNQNHHEAFTMILGWLNTKSYLKLKEGFSLKVYRSYIKGRCDGLYCGRGVMQVQTISHWWLTIAINQILLNMSWEQLLIRHWRQKWLIQVSGLDVVLQKQYFCVCILRCGLL